MPSIVPAAKGKLEMSEPAGIRDFVAGSQYMMLMSVLSVVRVIMEGTVSQLPAFYKITDTP